MDKKTKWFQMRTDDDFLTKIDNWRREQKEIPTRANAIRHLVDIALNKLKGQ